MSPHDHLREVTVTAVEVPPTHWLTVAGMVVLSVAVIVGLFVYLAAPISHDGRATTFRRESYIATGVVLFICASAIVGGNLIQRSSAPPLPDTPSIAASFYEEHNIADLRPKEAFGLGKIERTTAGCHSSSPDPLDRPQIWVIWKDERGIKQDGTLTNMGAVDGECTLVLNDDPPGFFSNI